MKTERTQDARKVEPSCATQPALTPSPKERFFGSHIREAIAAIKPLFKPSPQIPVPPVRAQSDEAPFGKKCGIVLPCPNCGRFPITKKDAASLLNDIQCDLLSGNEGKALDRILSAIATAKGADTE